MKPFMKATNLQRMCFEQPETPDLFSSSSRSLCIFFASCVIDQNESFQTISSGMTAESVLDM